jgi:RNA polymerase sigma-70 factor (ECF subfamily)
VDGSLQFQDAEDMRKIAQGDRTAFLTLYDRYSARVYALSLKILRDGAPAEEVTQETFLKLWTRARTFAPGRGSLAAWLLTIARRTALDRLRLEARRPIETEIAEAEADGPELLAPGSDTEEARWQALRFALADLPIDQRRVIELAYYHGLSHREISDELSLPLGTVKTRMRLGMDRLRRSWLESNDGLPATSNRTDSFVNLDGEVQGDERGV